VLRSHNVILDEVAACDELEGLVIVHQDVEILDADLCRKLRRALSDPDVGVVGCVGASDVPGIAWWEGSVSWASAVYRYGDLGGGDLPVFPWDGGPLPEAATGEVEAVDGILMALSPWVVRNVRFDEALALSHGYDIDFCHQVRAAGRKVVTEDLQVAHHHALKLVSNFEPWVEAHMKVAEKWDDSEEAAWKTRARRAEARAAAAWLLASSKALQADARAREHERRLAQLTERRSWRLTAPLRRLNRLRKRRGADTS
jgi:GT2 family glycosyltransferase